MDRSHKGEETHAAAQGAKIDFSGGYQFLRFLESGGDNVPTGWGASFGVGKERIKFVADVGGHYEGGGQLHTFQGGLELSGKNKRVVPFVRLLAGLGYDGAPILVFTPEAGVKIMGNDHVGAQVALGFPMMTDLEDWAPTTLRFFVGIVYRK